jgi:FMN phosphatase YigB (HAD superfamily)
MILLCDLDGTLLSNSMTNFQPVYLKALGKHLASQLSPDRMIHELLIGTKRMLENENPLVTLEDAFDAYFYPQLGVEKQIIIDLILDFYTNVFPSLGYLTKQIPEAIRFIRAQISSGNRIVIATNPLFPRIATFNRLVWAGLPVDQVKYEMVTTYEFMHFAKPHASYYAEMLAYLGYPNEPVIMMGNDLEEDILAASNLNIPAFWLTSSEPLNGKSIKYPYSGTYNQLSEFLLKHGNAPYNYYSTSLTTLMVFMKATLAALHTYHKHGSGVDHANIPFNLDALISERNTREHASLTSLSSIEDFNFLDNEIIKVRPDQPVDSLFEFAQYRLQWLILLPRIDTIKLSPKSLKTLSSFIIECISLDRELLSQLADWNKEWPGFINPLN